MREKVARWLQGRRLRLAARLGTLRWQAVRFGLQALRLSAEIVPALEPVHDAALAAVGRSALGRISRGFDVLVASMGGLVAAVGDARASMEAFSRAFGGALKAHPLLDNAGPWPYWNDPVVDEEEG